MTAQGLQRVVVEHVTPEIDGGRFCIKKVVGDNITVEADVFADGHDYTGCRLLYKHEKENNWYYVPMQLINNDRYQASFDTTETGFYNYTVTGWVDHPLTWLRGFEKKHQDGQHTGVELLIGAGYLERMVTLATGSDRKKLKEIITLLKDPSKYELAVNTVLSGELVYFMEEYPDLRNASFYKQELRVYVDRAKAGFSTWYCFFPALGISCKRQTRNV